ncbi:MAG: phosphodiester glycosidase family protein, partial [Fusobacteriaceae bacterium]
KKYDISVIEIDLNRYKGEIKSVLAQNRILGLDSTMNIVEENGAVAGFNGGYFVFSEDVGTVGDLAGIGVINGNLVSESRDGAPALLIRESNGKNSVDILRNVKTEIIIRNGKKSFFVDGINRKLGKSFGGGNRDDKPTSDPVHDILTTDDSEIIVFNRFYDDKVEVEEGEIGLTVSDNGKISEIIKNGLLKIPEDSFVIKANGDYANVFLEKFRLGDSIEVDYKVTSEKSEIKLEKGIYMVNGGPTLVFDGIILNDYSKEGWNKSTKHSEIDFDKRDIMRKDRNGFYYNWVIKRHARTAVGITKKNKFIAVVVYGGENHEFVGASIDEMAKIMKSLGVEKALNLDGGGSSEMIIEGEITGKPSDETGERKVGDAIIFLD